MTLSTILGRPRRLLFVLVPVLLSGCGIVSFDVTRNVPEQRVPGSPVSGILTNLFGGGVPLMVDLREETQAHDTGPASAVYLKSFSLDITPTAEPSGDTDDFGFIDSVDVYIESTKSGTTLPRTKIADVSSVPDGTTHLDFHVVDGVDLKPYIDEGSAITSDAQGQTPPDDVTFDGKVVLTVHI